jgi:nicotinate-nucleotide--dimethylbenzimidazole phosphoribosyltransferase
MTETGQVPGDGLPEGAGEEAVLRPPHAEHPGNPADVTNAADVGPGWGPDPLAAQAAVPTAPVYTFIDQPGEAEVVYEEDDLLLMPGPQGSWSDPQPVPPQPVPPHAVPAQPVPPQPIPPQAVPPHAVPPLGAPSEAVPQQFVPQQVPMAAAPVPPAPEADPGSAAGVAAAPVSEPSPAPATHEPDPAAAPASIPVSAAAQVPIAPPAAPEAHEAGGRDSGSIDLGVVGTPPPAAEPAAGHPVAPTTSAPAEPDGTGATVEEVAPPAPPRRPLHMGPPIPDPATGGVVRSLADRGPATPVTPAAAQAPGQAPVQAPAPVVAPASAAPTPVTGPPTVGPEYLDVPRDDAAVPAQPVQRAGAEPEPQAAIWQDPASAAHEPAQPAAEVPQPSVPEPAPAAEPVPVAEPIAQQAVVPEAVVPEAVIPVGAEPVASEPVASEPVASEPGTLEPGVPAGAEAPAAPSAQPLSPAQADRSADGLSAAPEPMDAPGAAVPQAEAEITMEALPAAEPVQPAAPALDAAPERSVPGTEAAAEAAPEAVPAAAEPESVEAPTVDITDPQAGTEPEAEAGVEVGVELPAEPVAAASVADADGEADAQTQTQPQPQTQAAAPESAPAAEAEGEPDVPAGPPADGYDASVREAVHRVIRERRDIRNGFRKDPIPHEVLIRVLEAAHTAPSVGHSQPWDFVVIRSAKTREKMHELAMRQREAYAKSLPKGRAKQFRELKIEAILDTPVNIVVTADPTRGGRHTLGRYTQPQMAPYSSALAVENLWLAARAEGLGVGWVSFFDEREMVRELGLPEHLEVVAYLCVGYVDEFPEDPELVQAGWSKRRPLSWVVHEEEYGRRALPGEDPHDLLAETLRGIRPLDAKALGEAWERQKRMTKPAGALGMLEIISAQLSGLSRQCPPPIPEPAAVAIFAGDHGVHAQGVTAWPQEVTGQMVANFLAGGAVCNAFANQVGAEVCVIDVGVAADLPTMPGLLPRKVRPGTSDFTAGPAMSREEALRAIEVGIETARDLVAAGNKVLLTGEMGVANTTVSAALISAFTGADPVEVTGRGTGINDEMHARKVDVVRRGLELHQPDPGDPVEALAALGGLEHAAMVGLLLGAASLRTPVILDGVSAGAAALVARAIAPEVLAACIAGHRSAEPGHVAALTKLGLRPLVDLDLRLGEGTGALLALPLVQSAARAMHEVATFDTAGVTEKG